MYSLRVNSIIMQTTIFINTFLHLSPWPCYQLHSYFHLPSSLQSHAFWRAMCVSCLSLLLLQTAQPPGLHLKSAFCQCTLLHLRSTWLAHYSLCLRDPCPLASQPLPLLMFCLPTSRLLPLYHRAATWGFLRNGLWFLPYLHTLLYLLMGASNLHYKIDLSLSFTGSHLRTWFTSLFPGP